MRTVYADIVGLPLQPIQGVFFQQLRVVVHRSVRRQYGPA